ncbi:MAG: WD40 repeat domain-containing protein, partial [Isosphaeraceae bacterium]
VWSVTFNPDGKTLASASSDRTVRALANEAVARPCVAP